MTVCVGWISNTNAFLVTDSAETTIGGSNTSEETALGERHISLRTQVKDRAAKFAIISNAVIGSIVGDAQAGLNALDKIKKSIASGQTIQQAVTDLVQSSNSTTAEFQLLLAHQASHGPELIHIDTSSHRPISTHYADGTVIVLGSLPTAFEENIKNSISPITQDKKFRDDPDLMLMTSISILQAMAQRSNFIQHFVGGLFFGARVDSSGAFYQSDIVHIFFKATPYQNPNPIEENPLCSRSSIRKGLLIACSSIIGGLAKVFTNDLNNISKEEERDTLENFIKLPSGQTYFSNSPYFSLIDRNSGAILFLDCRNGFADYLSLTVSNLTLTKKVILHLKDIQLRTVGNTIPIKLLLD